jgi:hypothetical protein
MRLSLKVSYKCKDWLVPHAKTIENVHMNMVPGTIPFSVTAFSCFPQFEDSVMPLLLLPRGWRDARLQKPVVK